MDDERRHLSRRNFSYYMYVYEEETGRVVGSISDISTGGFRLESRNAIPLNVDFHLRVNQTGAISRKDSLDFTARAKWCERDRHDPVMYNVGFQLIDVSPSDYDIFVQMFNIYGRQNTDSHANRNLDFNFG